MKVQIATKLQEQSWVAGDLSVLDGLRGLAAIYVMLYHVRAVMWVGWNGFATDLFLHSLFDVFLAFVLLGFRFGQEAVLLFFLLSGFVIHYRQAKQVATIVISGAMCFLTSRTKFASRTV